MKSELDVIPKLKKVRFLPGEFTVTPEISIHYSAAIRASTISIFKELLSRNAGTGCRSSSLSEESRYLKVVVCHGKPDSAPDESGLNNIRRKNEGYLLEVRPGEVVIAAFGQPGIFYGLATFFRLVKDKKVIRCCRIIDFPSLKVRGIHFDLKGSFPTANYLKSAIEALALYKINTILMEYEDKIKYDKHPAISHPHALSKKEWRRIGKFAADRFINIIPLQQCLGHAEYILINKKYRPLAENGNIQQLCPSHPGSKKVVEDLLAEIMEVNPDSRYFHIGGDEAFHLGECPACRKKDKNKLYLDWILEIASFLREQGKTAVIWDDMLRERATGALKEIRNEIVLMYWQYGASPGFNNSGTYFEKSREYVQNGFSVIAGSGAKGVTGFFSNLGLFEKNAENIRQWTGDAVKCGFEGVVSTAWSRWGSLLPPCEIFETGWHAFLFSAECFWAGGAKSKDDFNRRFAGSFLGIDDPKIVPAIFSLNDMPLSREVTSSSKAAAEAYLRTCLPKVRTNRRYLETLLLFSRVESHIWDRGRMLNELFESHRYMANRGLTDDFKKLRIGWLNEQKKSAAGLTRELRELLKPMIIEPDIEELIDGRFSFEGKELNRLLRLFAANKPRQ